MRGSGLKRYDPQAGSGFFKDMLYDAAVTGARQGWRGFKKDPLNPRKAIRSATSAAKRSIKNSGKRKAKEILERTSKRVIDDIFGKPTPRQ